uniref:Uncharacterized protein n=1 Tax=Sus scrofa TaxID=9823 RepID=A0A8D1XT96_PIG
MGETSDLQPAGPSLTGLTLVVVAPKDHQVPSKILYKILGALCLLIPILLPLLLHPRRPRLHPRILSFAVEPHELRVVHVADLKVPGLPVAGPGHDRVEIPHGVRAWGRGEVETLPSFRIESRLLRGPSRPLDPPEQRTHPALTRPGLGQGPQEHQKKHLRLHDRILWVCRESENPRIRIGGDPGTAGNGVASCVSRQKSPTQVVRQVKTERWRIPNKELLCPQTPPSERHGESSKDLRLCPDFGSSCTKNSLSPYLPESWPRLQVFSAVLMPFTSALHGLFLCITGIPYFWKVCLTLHLTFPKELR